MSFSFCNLSAKSKQKSEERSTNDKKKARKFFRRKIGNATKAKTIAARLNTKTIASFLKENSSLHQDQRQVQHQI
jgi:hypothetical protein